MKQSLLSLFFKSYFESESGDEVACREYRIECRIGRKLGSSSSAMASDVGTGLLV
jgi:hypothetical protein